MESIINYLKPTYEEVELKDPYMLEIRRTEKKKVLTLEEYARYSFIIGCRGFWTVNYRQNIEFYANEEATRAKVPEEEMATGEYHDYPGLLNWCRCFVLQRQGYETAALNHLNALEICIREDAVLRSWEAHVSEIETELEEKEIDISDLDPNIFNVFNFRQSGFKVPPYYVNEVYNGTTQSFEKVIGDQKLKSLIVAKNGIVAMIKFLRLSEIFLELLGKKLKFDPSAFKTNPWRWNEIIIKIGGIFQSVEMYLLNNKHPAGLYAGAEETKKVWRNILDEIEDALKFKWSDKTIKDFSARLKLDPFHFYEVPSDVDFILSVFGAEKDY